MLKNRKNVLVTGERDKGQWARVVLAVVRIVNGGLALVAPQFLFGRIETASPQSPAAHYAFRLFGIRTVIIGAQLLGPEPRRGSAVADAPLIHASDTMAALMTLNRPEVPRRNAVMLVAISAVNTALALRARRVND